MHRENVREWRGRIPSGAVAVVASQHGQARALVADHPLDALEGAGREDLGRQVADDEHVELIQVILLQESRHPRPRGDVERQRDRQGQVRGGFDAAADEPELRPELAFQVEHVQAAGEDVDVRALGVVPVRDLVIHRRHLDADAVRARQDRTVHMADPGDILRGLHRHLGAVDLLTVELEHHVRGLPYHAEEVQFSIDGELVAGEDSLGCQNVHRLGVSHLDAFLLAHAEDVEGGREFPQGQCRLDRFRAEVVRPIAEQEDPRHLLAARDLVSALESGPDRRRFV